MTPPEPAPDAAPKPTSWARGAALRGLVALPLVAGLATAGWLVTREDAPAAAPPPVPVPAAKTGAPASGPSVLEVSAPVKATEPSQGGASGGRNPLQDWADKLAGPLDIPANALIGYANGELQLRSEQPGCHLSWVTLAGVGSAHSNHGRTADPRRGPLGLSPAQWAKYGGGVPGIAKPAVTDLDSASVAAGRALCSGGGDLGGGNGWWKAVANYKSLAGGGNDTGSDAASAGKSTSAELFRQRVLGTAQLYATLSLDPAKSGTPAVRATRFALGQLGLPYVWGGNGPEAGSAGFDCSGLTKAAYDSAGVALPRTAHTQYLATQRVPGDQEPKLGDLVFYGNPAVDIHHVGLYLGNGLMINAPTEGQAVQIHTYHTRGDDYAGAGRPA
ncbi:C40 family peptidase [Amycolatopsis samaneae]|uniref:C40 family peptidase n=1 Tax=Amycolatopsis samaneae TaxID=664691 RepID=A0ABW5GFG8_9PSEU